MHKHLSVRVKAKMKFRTKRNLTLCMHTHREHPVAALVVIQPSPHLGGRRCGRLHCRACVGVCEHLDGAERRGLAGAREHKQARRMKQRVCRRPRRQGGDEVLPHGDRERNVFVRRFQQGQQLDSGNPPQRRVATRNARKARTRACRTYVGSAAGNASSAGTAYTGALAGNDASMARTQSANLSHNYGRVSISVPTRHTQINTHRCAALTRSDGLSGRGPHGTTHTCVNHANPNVTLFHTHSRDASRKRYFVHALAVEQLRGRVAMAVGKGRKRATKERDASGRRGCRASSCAVDEPRHGVGTDRFGGAGVQPVAAKQ